MEIYLPKWGLEILISIFSDRMYILCFDFNTKPTSSGQIDRFQTFVKFTHI